MTEQEQKAFDQMRGALEHCEDSLQSVGLTITASIANEALTAANAVSHPQATEPAGYKLVPVEPTQEMCDAARWSEYGEETSRQYEVSNEFIQSVWASLLAAAPEAHHE